MTPSDPDCERKTALVTGAGRRIGRAIALALAGDGWKVAVHYNRSDAEARAVVEEIAEAGGRSVPVRGDLGVDADVAALIDRAAAEIGPLTCLINNASVFERDEVMTTTRAGWDRHMQVNLWAPFMLTQALVSQLPDEAGGNVINILDQRVWNLTPHFTSYTVSKAALWTLTRTMALALAPRVRVNAVGPGPTLPSPRQTEAQFARQWSGLPLARPASPEEIADAVRFLLDAPSLTGQMIAVDSGQHLGWGSAVAAATTEE
ncbi:MAG: SDR family oxidoreductase [Rhodospirillales bacterium]|nr:MAG: SDR family oxidoreductase [Rhodospirillales bacterium]